MCCVAGGLSSNTTSMLKLMTGSSPMNTGSATGVAVPRSSRLDNSLQLVWHHVLVYCMMCSECVTLCTGLHREAESLLHS